MKKIVITGANGFIGRNLVTHLSQVPGHVMSLITKEDDEAQITQKLQGADYVFHLAGANRPQLSSEFEDVNFGLTRLIFDKLNAQDKPVNFVISSSTQALLDNEYGRSKKKAEDYIIANTKGSKIFSVIYRLPGVFGKWCRPNYNSVVATYCYNISRNIPITIKDPGYLLKVVYIDDVCHEFAGILSGERKIGEVAGGSVTPVYETTLQELVELLTSFAERSKSLLAPAVSNPFIKKVYSTFLSYLPETEFAYDLPLISDERGSLFELIKSPDFGQIFISTTKPGVTRGNHYHHTKTEKFCVIKGAGTVRFCKIGSTDIIEYMVTGESPRIIDIPPGYSHNITNTGDDEMITLFWANEIFDKSAPDTYQSTINIKSLK